MSQIVKITIVNAHDLELPAPLGIGFDVEDIVSPIRFRSSSSRSYFATRKLSDIYPEQVAIERINYQSNETLTAIAAKSNQFIKLTVTKRDGRTLNTPETYIFVCKHVSENVTSTLAGGAKFFYFEGAPRLIEYEVSETVDNIVAQTTPAGGSSLESIIIAASDETTALSVGTAKVTFRMPYAFTLTKVKTSLTAAAITSGGGGGPGLTVNVKKNGTTIFSTKSTIDVNQTTSETATAPSVISVSSFANDDIITIDIDAVGTNAAGLKVYLIGNQ